MRAVVALLLGLICACGADREESPEQRQARIEESRELVARITEGDAVLDRIVELGELDALLEAVAPASPPRARHLACLALGRIGGKRARDRLVEALAEYTRDPQQDGPMHLYAAAGLTLLHDPGTAVDLVLNLSAVNPNDNIAVLASEERTEEYFPVDAQICDALLTMGMWEAEEELVAQLRRRDRIRVLIDAYAVLRRHTGLELPFRYNGSYRDRNLDADGWLKQLRQTRDERRRKRPFDATDPHFASRCRGVASWLGGTAANLQLMARKVFLRLGRQGVPFLVEALESDNLIAQRQAALLLGLIAFSDSAPALRNALQASDPDVRARVVHALTAIEDRVAWATILPFLDHRDAGVRATAAAYLGRIGALGGVSSQDAVAPLRSALEKETIAAPRTEQLCALLRLGQEDVAPALIEEFVGGQQHDRGSALRALKEFGAPCGEVSALSSRQEREQAAARMRAWLQER
ncbi:MAG: HEAT repeat domain-containing protein [Planctomycetota bacterium]|jgi:HEAT repeat protein